MVVFYTTHSISPFSSLQALLLVLFGHGDFVSGPSHFVDELPGELLGVQFGTESDTLFVLVEMGIANSVSVGNAHGGIGFLLSA